MAPQGLFVIVPRVGKSWDKLHVISLPYPIIIKEWNVHHKVRPITTCVVNGPTYFDEYSREYYKPRP